MALLRLLKSGNFTVVKVAILGSPKSVLPPSSKTAASRYTNRSTSSIPCPVTSADLGFVNLFAAVRICPH